jgi:hypothetical protein
MATRKRIDTLKQLCQQLRDTLNDMTENRDQLLACQNELFVFENGGENLVPTLIKEANDAILQWQKLLAIAEPLRDKAIRGEDV